jgi:hypothetical protein
VIRLLALDLDGTLIGADLTLSPRVRQAVARAQDTGVTVTLATGRTFNATLPFARELNITAPLICYQGGHIQRPDEEDPLYRATMEGHLMEEALNWRQEKGWHLALYADDAVFLSERRYSDEFYTNLVSKNIHWVDDLPAVLRHHQPIKFIIIAESDDADEIEREVRKRFAGRLEIVRSFEMFVEGNPPGVSKGDALRRLAEHLGIPQAQVMAIGDQDNDTPMVKWAGVGVAMGGGHPSCLAAADWVAPPLDQDGAATAIEKFILSAA